MAASYDLTVERGANKPDKAWRMSKDGQPFDGTGSVFILTIRSAGVSTSWRTDVPGSGLTYDSQAGRLLWVRTLADSRRIEPGPRGYYEIERHIAGNQSVLVEGKVIGKGGLSDD